MYIQAEQKRNPVLSEMRGSNHFLRVVASVILFVFTFVFYSPAVYAVVHNKMLANNPTAKERYENSFEATIEQLQEALEELNRLLPSKNTIDSLSWTSAIENQLADDPVLNARINVVEAWNDVEETKLKVVKSEKDLKRILSSIKKQSVKDRIVAKQISRQGDILKKYKGLEKVINGIKDASQMGDLKTSAYNALRYISQNNPELPAHIYNAGEMPFGVSSDASRSPYRTEEALHQYLGLDYDPELNHETTGINIFKDFSTSDDVDRSKDIKDLAAELGKSPKNIYNWVYNNIHYIPSFGSIQGATQTLHNKQGNAFDIASLLISLLRESNVPARYVYGTVLMSADQVNNWVGGVDDIQSARVIMAQGGIPGSAVSYGGRHEKLRFEHVWVEAYGLFNEDRRFKWNPMDAAFKQYNYTEGVDLLSEAGIDSDQFQGVVEHAGTVNEAEGWVSNVDITEMQTQLAHYQTAIQDYLSGLPENTVLSEVIGGQKIIKHTADSIPALPYEDFVRTRSFAELPDKLRHYFRVELASKPSGIGGALGGSNGTTLMSFQQSLPQLAGKELALSFRPATVDDEGVVASIFEGVDSLEGIPTELDAGLFDVVGEVTVNGVVVASSEALPFGSLLQTHKGFIDPRFGYRNTSSPIVAGDYQAIGIDLQGVTGNQFLKTLAEIESVQGLVSEQNFDGLNRHDLTGKVLQAGVLMYFSVNDVMTRLAALLNGFVHYRMPSFGTFSTHSQVDVFWGAANTVKLGGMVMDIDWLMANNEGKVNCWQDWVAFNSMTGQMASAYEHVVPEQMFSTEELPVEFVSTVKALQIANQEGQRIYTITPENIGAVLPLIDASGQIKNDIQLAVAAGNIAKIHERPIHYQDYIGSGYVLLDEKTGSGAYKISGGGNGAMQVQVLLFFLSMMTFALGAFLITTVAGMGLGLASMMAGILGMGCALSGILEDSRPAELAILLVGEFLAIILIQLRVAGRVAHGLGHTYSVGTIVSGLSGRCASPD